MRLHASREEQDWWPNEEQLAAALSRHRGSELDPAAIDDISCEGFEEEATEFDCQWLQVGERVRANKERWHGTMAIDGETWILIDEPYQHFKPVRLDRVDPFYMNGETVLLHGLLRCGAFGCWISGNGSALGIAGRPGPEAALSRLAGRRVYLKAIVTDVCARSICVDQAPALILVAVSARPFAQMTATSVRPH